jgi:hypothetical protein
VGRWVGGIDVPTADAELKAGFSDTGFDTGSPS